MKVKSCEGSGADHTIPPGAPDHQPIYLTAPEAAALLRLSPVTLARWRIEGGGGPVYRKFGRRVLYARSDLVAWADAQRRGSTSELSIHTFNPTSSGKRIK